MATQNTFAERLTELREQTGKKRQEVADDLEISRASLEYYEKGKRKPDIEVLVNISNYYKVSTDFLLGLSDVPTTDKDLQFVCDYTGLDEKTVKALYFYKNNFIELIGGKNTNVVKEAIKISFSYLNGFISNFDFYNFYLDYKERNCIINKYENEKKGKNQNPNHLRNIKRKFERNLSINTFVVTEKYKKIYEEFCKQQQKDGESNGNNPQT